MIEAYHRLISWVDRPSVLVRLGIAFVASWVLLMWQVRNLDAVPPDFIDKGLYCLQAFDYALSMSVFRPSFFVKSGRSSCLKAKSKRRHLRHDQ